MKIFGFLISREIIINKYVFKNFINKILKIPKLSKIKELQLGIQYNKYKNKKIYNKLIFHNIKLAVKIAIKNKNPYLNIMDLIQESLFGVSIAAKKWVPEKGPCFGSYAFYWIKARLLKFEMENSSIIRIDNTRIGRKVYFCLSKIKKKLNSKGYEPNCDIVAEIIKEKKNDISRIISRLGEKDNCLFVNFEYKKENSSEDFFLTFSTINPEYSFFFLNKNSFIKKVLANFELTIIGSREFNIWKNYLISFNPISLKNLGLFHNVSKQRISQIVYSIRESFKKFLKFNIGIKNILNLIS